MIKDIFTVELLKNFIIRDIYLDFLGSNHIIETINFTESLFLNNLLFTLNFGLYIKILFY